MIPSSFQTGNGASAEDIQWTGHEPTVAYDRAVVIAYGSEGLDPAWEPEITRHAKALATEGILAIIPDYFQVRPAIRHGDSPAVFLQIQQRHDEWAQVLRDAVKAVRSIPGIDPGRVGLLGFSLGGFLSLRIRDTVSCIVEYFAPYRFPPNIDLGLESPLMGIGPNSNPSLKAHIHHGQADTLVPLQLNADPIKSALVAEGAVVTNIYFPGADHGFSGTDTANSHARNTSFNETISFFKANL